MSRSIENQCWKRKDFLESEDEFKFLVHTESGVKWLAHTDQEISDLVHNVTKAKGFFDDVTFNTFSTISAQCLGNDKWKFLDNIPG